MKYILYLVLFLFGNILTAQDNQAYIEYEKVVKSISVYSKTRKDIDLFKRELNDSLEILIKEYQEVMHKNNHKGIKMCPTKVRKLEEKLQKIESKIKVFKTYAKQEMSAEYAKTQKVLKTKIHAGVKQYCAERDISIMVDKNAVLFCEDCVNHTNELIIYLQNTKESLINKI